MHERSGFAQLDKERTLRVICLFGAIMLDPRLKAVAKIIKAKAVCSGVDQTF